MRSAEYKFAKSVCERYDLRFNDGFGWAIFTIDENGGLFNCHSDYGDYTYSWPRHGRKSFKHFLIEISIAAEGYLLNKVSNKDCVMFEETIADWKKTVISWRKEGSITKKEARTAFEDIDEIEEGSEDYIYRQMQECSLSDICSDSWEVFSVIKDYPINAKTFATKLMPVFADILRKELNEGVVPHV